MRNQEIDIFLLDLFIYSRFNSIKLTSPSNFNIPYCNAIDYKSFHPLWYII